MLPKITLSEARERVNNDINNVISFIDESGWGEPYGGPIPAMSAMWCDADQTGYLNEDAGITLPGTTDLLVKRSVDMEKVMESVAASYEKKPGWLVERQENFEAGRLQLSISAPDGYEIGARYFVSGQSEDLWNVSVSSFSPCIPVPEDYNPDKEY